MSIAQSKFSKSTILAIGTPIIDYIVTVGEVYLEQLSGIRGGSQQVDYDTLYKILKETSQNTQSPILKTGGSAANTIKGLAMLGHSCAFFGKIGNDEAGQRFKKAMDTLGIESKLLTSNLPTGQVISLITPDYERTQRSFLGAGFEMKVEEIVPELFQGIKLVHIEGFLLEQASVVQRTMELAKAADAKISFDVSSVEIVSKHKKMIIELLSNYVDIVFANEIETHSLTGLDSEAGCDILKDLCEIAVVKMGAKGCWGGSRQEKNYQPAFLVEVVDTTGAGDLFASGFLHGYLNTKTLSECLRYGALIASYIVQVPGAELSLDTVENIHTQF